jgi:hypothetical protein
VKYHMYEPYENNTNSHITKNSHITNIMVSHAISTVLRKQMLTSRLRRSRDRIRE